jgi:murein peptide amidase A
MPPHAINRPLPDTQRIRLHLGGIWSTMRRSRRQCMRDVVVRRWWRGAVIGLAFCLAGCVGRVVEPIAEPAFAPAYAATAAPSTPTLETPKANPAPMFEQVVLGRSIQGREITMHTLRGGPRTVLVMGGIHGSEPTSVDVAEGLLELLRTHPHLAAGKTVSIITVTNPDGYARRSRYNANQIDINRNFAATNFKPGRQAAFRSGDAPNSEPETQAIIRAIELTRPVLLISIHSIARGRECNNYDGPAEHIANIMTQHNGYPSVPTIGYPTPGSLGSYAGIDKQIPMITLELPRTLPGDQAWETNRQALLAALAAG